jgi:gamma-glutamyl:cysteine ligase YbdK (ATP-grasp superfamily)
MSVSSYVEKVKDLTAAAKAIKRKARPGADKGELFEEMVEVTNEFKSSVYSHVSKLMRAVEAFEEAEKEAYDAIDSQSGGGRRRRQRTRKIRR